MFGAGRSISRARRGAAAALVALGALGAVPPLAAAPASAAAGEGMEILCSDSGYRCLEGTGYKGQSRWGANYFRSGHNCTSYVSWILSQAGAEAPWYPMGNANVWDDRGRGRVPVDDVAAVGAVAQWDGGSRGSPGARGHVGIVEIVTENYIEVTDDTSAGVARRLRIHRGSPYWPTSFVHIPVPIPVPELASLVWGEVVTTKAKVASAPGLWSSRHLV